METLKKAQLLWRAAWQAAAERCLGAERRGARSGAVPTPAPAAAGDTQRCPGIAAQAAYPLALE